MRAHQDPEQTSKHIDKLLSCNDLIETINKLHDVVDETDLKRKLGATLETKKAIQVRPRPDERRSIQRERRVT